MTFKLSEYSVAIRKQPAKSCFEAQACCQHVLFGFLATEDVFYVQA